MVAKRGVEVSRKHGTHKAGWLRKAGVAIHTGSRVGNDRKFSLNAVNLARSLVLNGFNNIWYGDGDAGTMGLVAESAIAAGGNVYGVSLDFFQAAQGDGLPGCKGSYAVPTMPIRMHMMRNGQGKVLGAAANILNPGSYGTMEEGIEWLVSKNPFLKPQIWLNLDGYWDPFNHFLERMVDEGFEKPSLLKRFRIAANPSQAVSHLKEFNRKKAQADNYEITDFGYEYAVTETKHALIVRPASLKTVGEVMSRIVTYDVSNIPGQTLFKDPEGVIKPAIFVGDYYQALREQIYHIIGTGFSPEERRQFFHFVANDREAAEIAAELDGNNPLRPSDLRKKHQESLSLEQQHATHPALESFSPDSLA